MDKILPHDHAYNLLSEGRYDELIDFITPHEIPEDEWEMVIPVKHYARKRSLNIDWAAYVIPLEPMEGELFYVEDLIEDILVSEFWSDKIYAIDGIAKWNGHELEFRRDLYDSSECMIVG